MNLNEKLLKIQQSVDAFVKDSTIGEGKTAYKAVSGQLVLDTVRPLMNDLHLMLKMQVEDARVMEGKTSSGTSRYFTEVFYTFTWIDVDSGETDSVKWYGQGVDLAGEKGVGKAATYAEKYFIMKQFHVPTPADDPDSDPRTKGGEKAQRGTQAEAENRLMMRKVIPQMIEELSGGDEEKAKQMYVFLTKNPSGKYAGVDSISAIKDTQLAPVYGKCKEAYKKKFGKDFEEAE